MNRSTPSSYEERQQSAIDHSKCLCRIWNKERLDNIQCSSRAVDGDYCKTHTTKISEYGSWWLGIVTEPRPEKAMGPPTKPVDERWQHKWYDQMKQKSEKPKKSEKQEKPKKSEKQEKPKKSEKPKKRGRPRKEKLPEEEDRLIIKSIADGIVNKVIDEELDGVIDNDPDIGLAGGVGLELIPDKPDDYPYVEDLFGSEDGDSLDIELFEDNSSNLDVPYHDIDISSDEDSDEETKVENAHDFEFEGVKYKRLPYDDLIMDWLTGTQMGYLKDGKFTEFFNDGAKKLHERNKQL